MRNLLFFSNYIQQKYGKKLYRIPIDLALGCPNRENRFGPGCIFCAENGSLARHLARHLNLHEQIARGIDFARSRYGAEPPYIAYFQSFTNTFAPVDTLRKLYSEALNAADFRVVIIATRPDALPEKVLDYLAELNSQYELWVELGVQTANDRTSEIIRRGHDFNTVKTAVNALAQRNIRTACHLIAGLPGENMEDFIHTAQEVAKLPFSAVKFHQLQILKNTELARCYQQDHGFVTPLNEYAYADILRRMILELPDDMMIMRLVADADPEDIVAPKWWMNKSQFLEFFQREFHHPSLFPQQQTADGSITLYHPKYRQHFHSLAGADAEAEHKFIEASSIRKKFAGSSKNSPVRVLDVGFGLGGNTIATIKAARQYGGFARITALEMDSRVIEAAMALHPANSEAFQILNQLLLNQNFNCPYGSVELILDDARKSVVQLQDHCFDFIWLDGFSPDCNPELWSYDFIRKLAGILAPQGEILTYSASFPLRGAMLRVKLAVGETEPFGRRKGGTIAAHNPEHITSPLREKERNIILHSTAGVPLRDFNLAMSAKDITNYHAKLVAKLRKAGVPKWFKPAPANR